MEEVGQESSHLVKNLRKRQTKTSWNAYLARVQRKSKKKENSNGNFPVKGRNRKARYGSQVCSTVPNSQWYQDPNDAILAKGPTTVYVIDNTKCRADERTQRSCQKIGARHTASIISILGPNWQ